MYTDLSSLDSFVAKRMITKTLDFSARFKRTVFACQGIAFSTMIAKKVHVEDLFPNEGHTRGSCHQVQTVRPSKTKKGNEKYAGYEKATQHHRRISAWRMSKNEPQENQTGSLSPRMAEKSKSIEPSRRRSSSCCWSCLSYATSNYKTFISP
jgi:hypothetical protein